MTTPSIHVDFVVNCSLQEQLREKLITAILTGIFLPDKALPSCRKLASQLSISGNTVAWYMKERIRIEKGDVRKMKKAAFLSKRIRRQRRSVWPGFSGPD
ncbi:Bacterial regulatory proteins, gntR family [Sodalis glossinidius str. 'morsitans']|uniref:Bacterial regulatory proteins, gntR family n=1 Tax=Sodalis glossinidius (strain morsitans) TaxID=343509 RepID=A0A193QJS4_SODGM|nr:Bacterial regulatory proteins, gntR family [Sodalis glossinidius str. 'morsitans']